jgi:rare lipoprotein A
MDGSITMRLRVGLAAAAVLGLGGALAPGYAKDTVPLPLAAAAIADPAVATPALTTPDADDDSGPAWQTVGAGTASWYGAELAGHRTASGERFNPNELTAAHRTLPLGSHVRVTYQGRSVIVRINDRGPFAGHRLIDLSRAAAEQIGLRRAGSGRVTLSVLEPDAHTDTDTDNSVDQSDADLDG